MEKILVIIIALYSLIGCSENKKQDLKIADSVDTHTPNVSKESSFDTILNIGKSTFGVFHDTTNKMLRFRISKKVKEDWQNNIEEPWTSLYEFIDWNNDSYTDIILRYPRNYNMVLLFNPKKEKFVKFGNSVNKIESIKGTNLMYSLDEYRLNWNSELFAINENYQKINYGVIHWVEGDTNSYLSIYKRLIVHDEEYYSNADKSVIGNRIKPIEKIEAKNLAFFKTDDFQNKDSLRLDFIKNYWSKNWASFFSE